jgi:hypothetical protein
VSDLPSGEQLLRKEISIDELEQYLKQLPEFNGEDQSQITLRKSVSLYMLPDLSAPSLEVEITLPAIIVFRLIVDELKNRYPSFGYRVMLT